MKKQIMILVTVLSFSLSMSSYAQRERQEEMTMAQKRQYAVRAYISSLILSGGIGAVTGGVLKYLEKKFAVEKCPFALFVTLLGWALESELRNDIVVAFQRDLDQNGIEYKKGLMFKGAWISSWLSYLHA